MQITVKLFPTLHVYAPAGTPRDDRFSLEVPAESGRPEPVRIIDVVRYLGIPSDKVALAIVNGRIVRDFDRIVEEGDALFLSPLVGGG